MRGEREVRNQTTQRKELIERKVIKGRKYDDTKQPSENENASWGRIKGKTRKRKKINRKLDFSSISSACVASVRVKVTSPWRPLSDPGGGAVPEMRRASLAFITTGRHVAAIKGDNDVPPANIVAFRCLSCPMWLHPAPPHQLTVGCLPLIGGV